MKKNQLTYQEANQLYKRLKETARPSEQLKEFVHNKLMRGWHYLFQYRNEKTGNRHGYCTHCHKDMQLEGGRMWLSEYDDILHAKHGDIIDCPHCGEPVTKRYAGINRKNLLAFAAEFSVDESGALVMYIYRFCYLYHDNFKNDVPSWDCFQVGYFDIHRWFFLLYGWDKHVYLGDKYAGDLYFTLNPIAGDRFTYSDNPIYAYGLVEALAGSNLKYSMSLEFLKNEYFALIPYWRFYCSYPVIAERLIKQGHIDLIEEYLLGCYKGCFDFRKTTVPNFLKLDKEHYRYFMEKHEWKTRDLKTVQFMQKNRIPLTDDNYEFLLYQDNRFLQIEKLLKFMGIQKVRTQLEKWRMQYTGGLCHTSDSVVLSDYRDYIKQCALLDYDVEDKAVAVPADLCEAHNALTELVTQKKLKKKKAEEERAVKKFEEKRLPALQKKFNYSDGKLLIRAAESYEDLCKEGTVLHHCVYSNYADRYIKEGKTIILFIRRVSEPDKPFFTVECTKTGGIVQCRTLYNGGKTKEIDRFLKSWQQYLKQDKKKKGAA